MIANVLPLLCKNCVNVSSYLTLIFTSLLFYVHYPDYIRGFFCLEITYIIRVVSVRARGSGDYGTLYTSVSQSVKSNICKAPLKWSSKKRLLRVGLHKEPSVKARLELFATNITVLEMRWSTCSKSGVRVLMMSVIALCNWCHSCCCNGFVDSDCV